MKNIEFMPSDELSELYIPRPKPSKSFIPQWYKDIEPISRQKLHFANNGDIANVNVKMCMPFLDAMTGGYIQETWCDIYIAKENGRVRFNFSAKPKIMDVRSHMHIPTDERFYPYEFIWIQPWMPKLPKGYSVLLTGAMNRLDLPFTTISGIVDADHFYHMPHGNVPFYIKNDFEGLIPAGTPMYQFIPFKRESWSSSETSFNLKEDAKRQHFMLTNFIGRYKNNFWQKKNFT